MEIKKRNIAGNTGEEKKEEKQLVRVGNYECEKTKYNGIFKITEGNERYLVRCNYGKIEKIDKKTGVMKEVNEVTLKVVNTMSEARALMAEVEKIRNHRKNGIILPKRVVKQKITLNDVVEDFKKDVMYTDLSENYKMHYDNYFKHFCDFLGYKEPGKIKISDIDTDIHIFN